MKDSKKIISVVLLFVLVAMSWQCTKKYPADVDHIAAVSDGCVACHLDEDLLKKVAAPLPPVEGEAGEG